MFKERMTPDELARLTGYSRQTINKWVRKEGWTTSPKPGVQGGKARLVHVNEQVREYIRNAERPEGQGEAPALLPHSGVSLVFTGIAVSVLSTPAPECAQIIQGTIAAAAVINEIIAVFIAKKGFEWAGELNKAEKE